VVWLVIACKSGLPTIFWGNELPFLPDGTGTLGEVCHCLIEGFAGNAWSVSFRGNLDGTDPNAEHQVRIVGEHSLDLGQGDPWKEMVTGEATAAFGGMPGDLMFRTRSFVPLPEAQYLRLRLEK